MLLALRRVCPRYILCPLPLSIYFRHSHCYGQHAIFRSSVVLKHTWISPEQIPNKFMSAYRIIHGARLDNDQAREFVYTLSQEERSCLLVELNSFNNSKYSDSAARAPTSAQLRLVFLHQMLPFVGFGFLDNFLMIVAGQYIDTKLGVYLCISTMAAAAFGNMISDVAGIGLAFYVESFVAKCGVKSPHLTLAQVDMKSTRWTSSLGKMLGVSVGCLLGMLPLLFLHTGHIDDGTLDGNRGNAP